MARTLVKICGLSDVESARAALDAGADYLGFVFAPSRRRVSPEQARRIIRELPSGAPAVGVFVSEPPEEIDALAAECGLAAAQLAGDEPPEVAAAVQTPVLKSIRVRGPGSAAEMDAYGPSVRLFVLEPYQPGAYGGTGQTCDWALAADLAARRPALLAGGLCPENVGAAIAAVRPLGVDVSGGVEVLGRKDPARIAAFVEAVRRADR